MAAAQRTAPFPALSSHVLALVTVLILCSALSLSAMLLKAPPRPQRHNLSRKVVMSQDRSVLDEVAARLSAQQFLLEIVLAQTMRQMNFEVRRRFTDDILQVIQRTNTPTVKDELYAAAVADITGRMRELIAHIIRRAEDRVNSLAGE